MFDLLDQLSQARGRIHGTAVFVERGGETVNPYLHGTNHPLNKPALIARW
jgi:hypothetical protein